MEKGSAAVELSYLSDYDRSFGKWHRSKNTKQKSDTDYSSYMINKKWWLEEQFNVHMMRFQQVKYIYKSTVEHF